MGVYAVIKTGGKQYRVSPGDIVQVEKLSVLPGEAVEITDVFMLVKDEDVAIGNPTVANVRVIAEVVTQGRGEKIRVFKKRRRKHYQKTIGHRQHYSAIRIVEIVDGDKNYRASDAPASSLGSGKRDSQPAAAPTAAPDRNLETTRPETEPDIEAVSPSQHTGASPVFGSGDQASTAAPPAVADVGPAASTVEVGAPASTAFEPVPPATLPAGSGEAARPGALAAVPDESRPAMPQESRATPEEPTHPQPFAAIDAGPREAPRAITGERTPAASAATPNEEKSRHRGVFWFLASLLALLLGGLGWWFKGDEKSASAPAGVDAPPADQMAQQATAQAVSQPPVRELSTRKPARASVPSAPAQPPD